MLQLIEKAESYKDRMAIADEHGVYSYSDLLNRSGQLASSLLGNSDDLREARIAFMVKPGFDYVVCQWAIWRAGGIAVPVCLSYPAPSIEYLLDDAKPLKVLSSPGFVALLTPLCTVRNISLVMLDENSGSIRKLPEIKPDRRAMILYTSGTTGNPKGVVTTHKALEAQIRTLVRAWEWEKDDRILNVLPLHHVHGIVNALCCALWSGACCEFQSGFDAVSVFKSFEKGKINVFMAVPTIYYKLLAHFEQLGEEAQVKIRESLKKFRLMVSGSAALPVSVLEKWKQISGHVLLERYGMTEMGMAISNAYRGERFPGCIGRPLPGVTVRLVDEKNSEVSKGEAGEIQLKGENVFREYWNKPKATKEAFTEDGWFRTGDIAEQNDGIFRIIGRNSVDIIKSGGYKISALEIEEQLRNYPGIRDCAVTGIPDEEWGELITAALIADPEQIETEVLTAWLKDRLPGYKLPRKFIFLEELPRNAMGKVTKHVLKDYFEGIGN